MINLLLLCKLLYLLVKFPCNRQPVFKSIKLSKEPLSKNKILLTLLFIATLNGVPLFLIPKKLHMN